MGETWLCGEHFPCKKEVLVSVVVVDIFPFSRGATDYITIDSSTIGLIEVSSTVARSMATNSSTADSTTAIPWICNGKMHTS